jgi:PleD family two-component response regulator
VGGLDLRELGVPAVSVSIGLAVGHHAEASVDSLIRTADAALYDAKRGGRDRVVAA